MIFLLSILFKYRSDDWAVDESSIWDLSPEWLTDECKLVVLDKFEFENLEVNIINFFYFGLTQIMNWKNVGKRGSVLCLTQELSENKKND